MVSKCFKTAVLGFKKWCSENIFSDTKQKHVCWKICKVRKFFGSVAVGLYFQCQASWASLNEWGIVSEVWDRNCIVKCVIFFTSFCWLWDFLLENVKLKKNPDDVHWNVWTNIKTLYARNDIFKKRIPNMTFWIIYVLVWISFLWTGLGYLAKHGDRQNLSWLAKHGGRHLYSTTPLPLPRHHRKASYGSEKSSSFHNHFPQSTSITRTHYNYFPPLYWYK